MQNDRGTPPRGEDPRSDVDPFDAGGDFVTEAPITCAWCGAENLIAIDPGGGKDQDYVEDCERCCRPLRLQVTFDAVGSPQVDVSIDQ